MDSSANIIVADRGNSSIRVIEFSSGNVKTFAGGFLTGFQDDFGLDALFNQPSGVAISEVVLSLPLVGVLLQNI